MGNVVGARAFDFESLFALVDAIQKGIFGHYGKKRYYLVPLSDLDNEPGNFQEVYLRSDLQIFPNGGQYVNPLVIWAFTLLPPTQRK